MMNDTVVRNICENLSISGQFFIPKINIVFNNEHKVLGKFFEDENGKMSFEGDVNESAKIFIEYSLKSFNERIEQIKQESQPKNLWAECVVMEKKMGTGFEIILRHGFYFMSYPMFESDCLTLEELHAKLTELTKG